MNRYTLLHRLGHGGMGEVYLADDTLLERKVALKFLSEATRTDEIARERLLREARAAAMIDHPYICKVYDAGELDGRIFIGMEFVEGETLRARLSAGALPWRDAVRLTLEIAEALAQAHDRGIIHRDLKPANIMVARDGHVKVMDFGVATRVAIADDAPTIDHLTLAGVVMGTVAYMSPEQLRGDALDARSDLFSLGTLFYEMLTGRHPFARGLDIATGGAILYEPHVAPRSVVPSIPPALDAIVNGMLAKELPERYASARLICQDLRAVAGPPATIAMSTARSGLAVLPLVNIGGDEETEYFSDGITEDIIAELCRLRTIRVISRTSVMRYKGTTKPLAEISRELGVPQVLEGSVRRRGDRARIVISLVDVDSDTKLWSETYDHHIEDVFAVQSDVARHVALALKASASSAAPQGRSTAMRHDAYELYLKGRYFLHKRRGRGIDEAVRHFQDALAIDPADARIYAALSTCYADAGHFKYMPCVAAFAEAKTYAERALVLDDQLSEAHASMAMARLYGDWDWQGSQWSLTRALGLNPSFAEAHVSYCYWLTATRRFDDAIAQAQTARSLDPMSLVTNLTLGFALAFGGRLDQAESQLTTVLEMDPQFLPAASVLAYVYALRGRFADATALLEPFSRNQIPLGWVHAVAQHRDAVRAIIADVRDSSNPQALPCFDLALLSLLAGDTEDGFGWLEQACREHDNKLIFLNCYVELHAGALAKHVNDPRFARIARAVHLDR